MRGAPTAILIATLMAGGLAGGGMMMMRTGHAESAPDGFDALMAQSMTRMHADMAVCRLRRSGPGLRRHDDPAPPGRDRYGEGRTRLWARPRPAPARQGIIVEQAQEIEVMRRALAERPPAAAPATPKAPAPHHH